MDRIKWIVNWGRLQSGEGYNQYIDTIYQSLEVEHHYCYHWLRRGAFQHFMGS